MYGRRWPVAIGASLMMVLIVVSCGKKEEKEDANQTLLDIAKRAEAGLSLQEEAASLHDIVTNAGFTAGTYERFISQEIGKKGRVLFYADSKRKSGGIIYVKKTGNRVSPSWHWYFRDMVPDSIVPVEINEDGLWDLRIVSTKGRVERFIQDESFSFTAGEREDMIALNGESSTPANDEDAMWKCFDGDTATAFRSSTSAGEVFIELLAPFGVGEGVLTLQTLDSDQPQNCTVYADGKKLQQIELAQASARQMIRLNEKVVGKKKIRLVFSAKNGGGTVAIAEVALR